jgi:hypothetical protein
MLGGIETVVLPIRAVRTRPPSAGSGPTPSCALRNNVLTSPRLLNESSLRSSWL